MGVDGFEGAEITVEKLSDHFAEPGIVLGEAGGMHGVAFCGESFCEQSNLSAFAAAVDTFDGDEFSVCRHVLWVSLTAEAQGCNAGRVLRF